MEPNYLSIDWTDFYNISPNGRYLHECDRCGFWTSFADSSRDVAMATNYMAKCGYSA